LAQALENLIRPRPQSLGAANRSAATAPPPPSAKSAATEATTAGEGQGTTVAPPASTVMNVRPQDPAWFAPLAGFAERSPRSALAGVVLTLALIFGAGVLLGLMF